MTIKQIILSMFILVTLLVSGYLNAANYDSHPGVYIRHIIYFKDLSTAEKAFKNNAVEKFFKQVESFPETASSSLYNRYLIKDVASEFPMPDANYLSYFGRGMTDKERADVQNYKAAVLYDFLFPLTSRSNAIKNISRLVLTIAEQHDGYIWDSETRELFSRPEWKLSRIDSWSGDVPNIKFNTVIHAYQDTDGYRAISLGMAKFGLPDLVVNGFEWNDSRSISSLINLTAQQLVEQGLSDFKFEVNVDKLKASSFKASLVDSLYENANKAATIDLVESKVQEGDPDNFLLEFNFDQYDGKTKFQKQGTLLNSLFGWKDEVSYVKHNLLIEAASKAAKEKLPQLKQRFNAGLEVGESLSLKAPFPTTSGGNEWMWVEVTQWSDQEIIGILRNIPRDVPTLKEGDRVTVLQADVFDYIFYNKDGTSEGNKTGELILKYQLR